MTPRNKIYLPIEIRECKDDDGETYYIARCPLFRGCVTDGNTKEEVIKNIKEVISMYIEDIKFTAADPKLKVEHQTLEMEIVSSSDK